MRNTHGEGRSQVAPRQESSDIIGALLAIHSFSRSSLIPKLNVLIATRRQHPFGEKTTKAKQFAMRKHLQFHLFLALSHHARHTYPRQRAVADFSKSHNASSLFYPLRLIHKYLKF